MDPRISPQGTLSQIDNPLVNAAPQMDQNPQPGQPTNDTAQQPGLQPPVRPGGGASIGQILLSKNQSLPTVTSPHATKIGDSINKTLQTNPEAAQQPGGVMRAVVGGALDALKGVQSSLGDAANVGTVPAGGGALVGVARTLQAQQQRVRQTRLDQQETDKNKQMMAESNVRMMHEQRLVHKLDDDAKQQSVESGLRQIATLRTQASPTPALGEHLDSDQITQYIKDQKIDPTKETAIPDGIKNVGVDKDGNPVTRMTYTLMGVPPDVTLSPDDPKQKEVIDELNKYAPPANGGKWGNQGAQHFTGTEFNLAMQHSNDVRAATLARDKTLLDLKLMDKDNVRKLEAVNFPGTSDWVNALSHAPNHDPIAARNAMLSNPEIAQKYPNLDNDLREFYGTNKKGDSMYDKMLDDYQKKVDVNFEQITSLQKDLDKAHGEEAASIAQGLQSKIDDPNTPASAKIKLQQMLKQANNQAEASLSYGEEKKKREALAEGSADEGDLSALKDMVLQYQYEPDKLFSRFKGMAQKQKFLSDIHQTDPNWSEARYKARFKTNQDFSPEGKGGLAVQSLNTFAGHVGDANSLINSLQNTRSPMLNKPLNKIKEQLGNDKIGPYKAALEAAKKEYENFLNNQHAAHEVDITQMNKLLSEDTSPAAAQAILRQMAHTVAIRARSLNSNYRNTMEHDIPNFLDPDTKQVLGDFGIDPSTVTNKDVSGLVKSTASPNQVQPPPLPPAAMKQLQEGQNTTFANGQTWSLQNGKPVQVQAKPQGQ